MKNFSEEAIQALVDIDFVQRFEKISKIYSKERANSLPQTIKISKDEGLKIFQELGYSAKYYAGEKFYEIEFGKIGPLIFEIHISLWSGGKVELLWYVTKEEEMLLGGPWAIYPRIMLDEDYRIKYPVFATSDDLKEILEYTFKMYEDFKNALVRIMGEKKIVIKD